MALAVGQTFPFCFVPALDQGPSVLYLLAHGVRCPGYACRCPSETTCYYENISEHYLHRKQLCAIFFYLTTSDPTPVLAPKDEGRGREIQTRRQGG